MLLDSIPVITSVIRDTVYTSNSTFWKFDSSFILAAIALIISPMGAIYLARFKSKKDEEQMEKNNLKVFRKEWISECTKLFIEFNDIANKTIEELNDFSIERYDDEIRLFQKYYLIMQLKKTVEGRTLKQITDLINEFITALTLLKEQKIKTNNISIVQLNDTLQVLKNKKAEFNRLSSDIISVQWQIIAPKNYHH